MTYKVHLDGYNLMPALKGEAPWPRHEFVYWTHDGSVAALRYNNWKATFLKQNAEGIEVWRSPFEVLRAPMLTNLRMDPFERPSTKASVTTIGGFSTCSCLLPLPPMSANGSRVSGSFRRAKNLAASTSTV